MTWALFIVWEWKFAIYPIMPMGIFSSVSKVATLLVVFFHGFVFISGSYYLPTLLPGYPRRAPNPIRCRPPTDSHLARHFQHRHRYLRQESRHVPPTNILRLLHDDSRVRPIHQLRRQQLLDQTHHLPNHRGFRHRATLPSPNHRTPSPHQPPRHRYRDRNPRLRTPASHKHQRP